MIRASAYVWSVSLHTYQSRLGFLRDDRASTNHGCWSLVWLTTSSVMTRRPRRCAARVVEGLDVELVDDRVLVPGGVVTQELRRPPIGRRMCAALGRAHGEREAATELRRPSMSQSASYPPIGAGERVVMKTSSTTQTDSDPLASRIPAIA